MYISCPITEPSIFNGTRSLSPLTLTWHCLFLSVFRSVLSPLQQLSPHFLPFIPSLSLALSLFRPLFFLFHSFSCLFFPLLSIPVISKPALLISFNVCAYVFVVRNASFLSSCSLLSLCNFIYIKCYLHLCKKNIQFSFDVSFDGDAGAVVLQVHISSTLSLNININCK